MYLTEEIQDKWKEIVEGEQFEPIKDQYRKTVLTRILENQHKEFQTDRQILAEAAPINNSMATPGIDKYEPILISMVRRSLPNLMPFDVCGVQPMKGPADIIFAMRSIYGRERGNAQTRVEALFNEADTSFSSSSFDSSFNATPQGGAHAGSNPVDGNPVGTGYTTGGGMSTAFGEALGDDPATNEWGQMGFAIDKITVTAKTRALKTGYTIELAQDLKAVHGLDAESVLSTILSQELVFEINREVMRTIYRVAKLGSLATAQPGTFNLDIDSNGRWSVERFKGLAFNIERDCNVIGQDTRMGKGNFIVVSSDVASALNMADVLDPKPALEVDDTGSTFAGNIGKIKVFIDPYSANLSAANQFYVAGYKGNSAWDAGIYFAPYTMLQMVRAVDPNTLQPKFGYKTRYGLVSNPFVTTVDGSNDGEQLTARRNPYYRISKISNLL